MFVVVDSRQQNLGKNRYGGLNNMMKSLLYTEMSLERLDPRVGFYQIEMTQCWDDSPLGSGTWGGHLRRTAQPIMQSEELTAWVRAKMAEGPLL